MTTLLQLPVVADDSHFRLSVELDGRRWGFEFRWNHRAEQWVMAVLDGDGNRVVSGIRVVLFFDLLDRFRAYATLPPGRLIAMDTSGQNLDPGLADLGRRVVLVYRSAA